MEAYRVGMTILLQDNASAALGTLIAKMAGLDGQVTKITKGFASMSKAVIGVGAAVVGLGLGEMLFKVASHGDKLLDQQDKLRRAGISHNEVLQLQKRYYDDVAKAVPTSTVSEYLRTYNELRSVVGAERAAEKTPWALKLESIMQNMTGKSAQGEAFKIFRSLEMKGITISDPNQSERLAEIMMKNIIGSGGKLTARDFEMIAKRGGISWAQAGSRFVAGPLSNIASDLGGQSTGMALQTLWQMTSGATTLGKQQAGELLKLGLLDRNKVEFNKGGDMTKIKPGAMAGWKLAMTDPDLWAQKYLLPSLEKTYGTDRAAQMSSIAKIGRNRNVIRMLNFFTDPGFREQMMKDAELWAQAHGIDESYRDFIKNNPLGVKAAFRDQYESRMQSIGAPMMIAALPVMQKVTEMFTAIGKFANENPKKMEAIGKAIAIFGAALTGAGVAAIALALGPAGWLVGGIIALGVALARDSGVTLKDVVRGIHGFYAAVKPYAAIGWDLLKAALRGLWQAFELLAPIAKAFWNDLKTVGLQAFQMLAPIAKAVWADLQKLPDIFRNIAIAITPYATIAWDAIVSGLSSVKDAFNAAADWVIGIGTKLWNFVTTLGGLIGKTGFSGGGGDDGAIIKASYGGAAADFGGSTGGGGGGSRGGGVGGSNDNARRVGRRMASLGEQATSSSAPAGDTREMERLMAGAGGGFNVRGVKNMNPGNIAYGPWARAHGAIGAAGTDTGHGVAVFPSFDSGAAALASLALSKYLGGKRTIDQLIAGGGGWTPGNHAAAANVARMMGISPHADARLSDKAMMRRFRDALMVQELGPGGARHVRKHLKGDATASPGPPPKRKEDDRIISVHLDGHTVGKLVERRIVASHRFTRSSADHDGRAGVPPVDYHRVA